MSGLSSTARPGYANPRGNYIIIKVNDKVAVDYVDAKNTFQKGYLTVQQHDLESLVHYKDLLTRPLPAKR